MGCTRRTGADLVSGRAFEKDDNRHAILLGKRAYQFPHFLNFGWVQSIGCFSFAVKCLG